MGLLDDLAMGFGLKDRDAGYYERTAQTIGRNQGEGAEERYRQSSVFMNKPARGGLSMLAELFGVSKGDLLPPRTTVRPRLRPAGFSPRTFPTGNGQPETRFDTRTDAEPIDYSDTISVQDPATIAATEALASLSDMPTSYVPSLLDAGMDRFESDDARSRRAALAGSVPSITPTTLLMQDPNMSTSYGELEFGAPLAFGMAPKPVNDPAYPLGLAEKYSEAALSQMTPEMIEYLARIEAEEKGLTPITTGPHAGKYMDASGRLVMP